MSNKVMGTAGQWHERGYCFVLGPKGERIFVHVTDCPNEEPLAAGQVIELEVTQGSKGLRGSNITFVAQVQP